jgi:hypothetical protein
MMMAGRINNAGGNSTSNGGTVKLVSACGTPTVTGQVTSGRLLQKGGLMKPWAGGEAEDGGGHRSAATAV